MVRPQNLACRADGAAGKWRQLVGRLTDIMVSGSLTKLYIERGDAGPAAARRRLSDARRRGRITRSASIVSLDWQPADAVVIADERQAQLSHDCGLRRRHERPRASPVDQGPDGRAAGAAARRASWSIRSASSCCSASTRTAASVSRTIASCFASSVYVDVLLITLKISLFTTLAVGHRRLPDRLSDLDGRQGAERRHCCSGCCSSFWTSFLVRAFAWVVLLGRNGVVNQLLRRARHCRSAGEPAL